MVGPEEARLTPPCKPSFTHHTIDLLSQGRLFCDKFCDKLAIRFSVLEVARTMQDKFDEGCEHFNKREYFEAHEVWEDLWNEETGPRHAFLQCLIQVAVALHHSENKNWTGTRKLFASSLGYLEKGRSDCDPIDLDKLKDHVLDFELALQKLLAGEPVELPYFNLPRK